MAGAVLVHGIWNQQRGVAPDLAASLLADAARPSLEKGLRAAGLSHVPVTELAMAYYADLLAGGVEQQSGGVPGLEELSDDELREAWEWLLAAGVPQPEEAQAGWLAPVRQGLGWLVRRDGGATLASRIREEVTERLGRLVVALIRELDAYTSRPQVRAAVRDRVAGTIRAQRPHVVVAHSLGSVVAWETLHANPDLEVELLVTLGSPLGLPTMIRKLEPALRHGEGSRSPGVRRWVNIADTGDLVAVPPELGGRFLVEEHATTDIGLFDPHTLGGYLASGLTAAAIAPYLT